MDEAFRLGMEGLEEGTVVCAESQTKGRGRLGRRWTSQRERNLYVCYFKASLPPTGVAQLTLLAAVAVAEAVESLWTTASH